MSAKSAELAAADSPNSAPAGRVNSDSWVGKSGGAHKSRGRDRTSHYGRRTAKKATLQRCGRCCVRDGHLKTFTLKSRREIDMKAWTIAAVCVAALSATQAAETCVPNCNEIYKPVCGSDGKTYENQCTFDYEKCSKNASLTVVKDGPCASSNSGSGGGSVGCTKGCTKIFKPVCGSDGKTYSNQCELDNAACEDKTIKLASDGECGSSSGSAGACKTTMCTMDMNPVCGSDGKTYSNECQLKNAQCKDPSLTMVSTGECSASTKSGSIVADEGSGGSSDTARDTAATPSSVPSPSPTQSAASSVRVEMAAAAALTLAAALAF